jgi:putative flippase GtrA
MALLPKPVPIVDAREYAEGRRPSLASRLLGRRVAMMLGRNTVVSCATFLFDIVLLWLLVHFLGIDKYVAATIGFILATSIHYAFCRLWIFTGSERGLATGYVYFFINTGIGLVLTIGLFALFTDVIGMEYLVARVVASVFAGLASFILNAVLNFRSV